MQILVQLLQFFASLSLLVIVHEFGHFLMAKLFKVRVEKFYLFFNPWLTLFKFKPKKSETEYGVGWLPLGGYVKLAGMIDESLDESQMKRDPQPWEFRTKPAWQRLLIMVMGVVFNFLLALFIYSMIAFHYGDSYIPLREMKDGMEFSEYAQKVGFRNGDILLRADSTELIALDNESVHALLGADHVWVLRDGKQVMIDLPGDFADNIISENVSFVGCRYPFVIDSVMPDSRADRAGLMAGGSLVAIVNLQNDTLVDGYVSSAISYFAKNKNFPVIARVSRNGQIEDLVVTPNADGKIGVYMKSLYAYYPVKVIHYGFFESFGVGVRKGSSLLFNYAGDMKYVFTTSAGKQVSGFMTIGSLFPYPFNAYSFWQITAFLSIILAFMNILPIPALDGGHVLFLIVEVVTRKKPSPKFLMKAQIVGMAILFALMIYANLNDFFKFFS